MKIIKLKVNTTTGVVFENNRKVSTLAGVRGDVVVLAFEVVKTLDTGVDVPVDMSQISVIRHSIAKDRISGTLALVAGNAFNQLNDVAMENLSGGKFTMKLDLKSDKLAKALVDAGKEAIEGILEVSTIFPIDYPTTLLQLRMRIFGDIDHYQVTDPVKDFLLLSQNDFTDADKRKLDGLSAADNKVDKVAGKGLSTNDFTNAEKSKLDTVALSNNNKVDKIAGKGLSTNDFTNAEKSKLDGLSSGGGQSGPQYHPQWGKLDQSWKMFYNIPVVKISLGGRYGYEYQVLGEISSNSDTSVIERFSVWCADREGGASQISSGGPVFNAMITDSNKRFLKSYTTKTTNGKCFADVRIEVIGQHFDLLNIDSLLVPVSESDGLHTIF